MSTELSLNETKKEWHGSYRSYLIGFFSCLILTGISFGIVVTQMLPANLLPYALVALAITQAIVQLLLFLHVGQEAHPRWETMVFYFMVVVLLIVALGSLWIMYDLDKRVMMDMHQSKGVAS